MLSQVAATIAAVSLAAGLFQRLEGPDSDLRSAAIDSLAAVGRQRIEVLAEGLHTAGWRGREGTIEALTRIGEPALPLLASTARTHPKTDTRRLAVRAIGRVGGPAAADILLAMLGGSERDLAAQGLGACGDTAAVPALVLLLSDDAPAVRRRAVMAIGELSGTAHMDRIIGMMQDRDHGVRFAAAEALLKVGPEAVVPLGERAGRFRAAAQVLAARTLGRFEDPRARPYLTAFLDSNDWAVRCAAATALAAAGDSASAQLAERALTREQDPLARSLMKTNLARSDDP